jgi:hypothetical protein
MLKKMLRLVLGMLVLTGSACVTPTHASSAFDVVLTGIQATGPTGAKEEMVSLYNNTPNGINITNWCITNKSHVAFACFKTANTGLIYYLPPFSIAMVATQSFMTTQTLTPEVATVIYTVTNQTSGSIVNSGDVISLVNASGQVIDTISWTSAIPSGKLLTRTRSAMMPNTYEIFDASISWTFAPLLQIPVSQVEVWEVPVTGTPGDDTEFPPVDPTDIPGTPDTPTVPGTGQETGSASEAQHPIVNELLPDAEGSDAGNEFVELYNPTTTDINLADYKVRVGPNLEKIISFPAGAIVPSLGYASFSNSQMAYTLVNTTSSVQLEHKGQLIGQPVTYANPATGASWALIAGNWEYTTTPTPGTMNQASSVSVNSANSANSADASDDASAVLKPCAANQYRSLETNRCRLIATSTTATVTPCKVGQYRNPETNRCRSVAADTPTATECKIGQERNPETNRCRNVTKMITADYGVKGATTQSIGVAWYAWLGIAGVVVIILGYAIWEWRSELKTLLTIVRRKFARNKT